MTISSRAFRVTPALFLLPLLLSAVLPQPVSAARMAKHRVMTAEQLPKMTALNGLTVLPQQAAAVLVVDPRMAMGPNVSVALATNPSITGGTFAGGAAAGVAGALISTAVVEGQWQSVRDEVIGLLHAVETETPWNDDHAAWTGMLQQTLRDELGVAATLEVPGTPDEDGPAPAERCAEGDRCVIALTRWGLSSDARHLEAYVQLMIWSPELREAGKSPRRVPDYTNVLVYRSAPLDLPAEKTKADEELLHAAAMRVYRAQGIAGLVKIANDKKHPDSQDARKEANRLLQQHRLRLKDAKRGKWTDDSLAVRRALAWGEADGRRIREALQHAGAEVAGMLKVELSAEGQAAKNTGKFKMREAQAVAKVVREGEREWVYLNEGALVSRVSGDTTALPWNRALELEALTGE